MKIGERVRFREVIDPGDEGLVYEVVEDNGDRLLLRQVCDLPIRPTRVLPAAELVSDFQLARQAILSVVPGYHEAFRHGADWTEPHGQGAVLIVVHDGGPLAPFFNWDYCNVAAVRAMDKALAKAGFYAQQCTSWYTAIYRE